MIFVMLTSLIIAPSCLEKQPEGTITVDGTFGGVGGGGGKNALGSTKIGNVTGTAAVGAPAKMEHNTQAHEDKPAGFDAIPAGKDGEAAPDSPLHEDKPGAATHAEHVHVDRPGGYEEDGDVVKAVAGAPGGEASSGVPDIASPFEKEYGDKKMVIISGTIEAPDDMKGIGDMDCFVPDLESPARRRYVNKIKVRIPGEFKMKVPEGYGELILSAFLDVHQDGPDGSDPQGSYADGPLVIKDVDISGVDIILEVKPPPNITQ